MGVSVIQGICGDFRLLGNSGEHSDMEPFLKERRGCGVSTVSRCGRNWQGEKGLSNKCDFLEERGHGEGRQLPKVQEPLRPSTSREELGFLEGLGVQRRKVESSEVLSVAHNTAGRGGTLGGSAREGDTASAAPWL